MILGLAGNLLKSLGGKKPKSSGKEMAKNITNESNEKESVVKPSPPEKKSDVKGADLTPLEDIRDDMKASSKKSKDPLNLALDGIDSALFGIIDTLTKTNLLKKKIKSNENKEQQQDKKTLRERFLERGAGFVKGAVGTVKGLTGSAWDKLMNFLTWTLLGAVVNYIIKNWESVKEKIIGMVEQLKEIFERLKPILVIIKDIVLWFGTTAWDFIMQLNDIVFNSEELSRIDMIRDLVKDQESLEKKWKGNAEELEKFMKELEQAETREAQTKVMKKYSHLFDDPLHVKHNKLDDDIEKVDGKFNITESELIERISLSDKNIKEKKGKIRWNFKDMFNIPKNFRVRNELSEMVKTNERLKEILKEIQNNNTTESKISNNIFSSAMDIESHYVGLEEYSDVFDTESSIILFSEGDETGSKDMGSDFNFDYKMPESTLNIKDAFLLEKLNK